jgi:4a-hydroxytetrahydrobiopterin dehydratase
MRMCERLTWSVVTEQVDGRYWRVIGGRLRATFGADDFAAAAAFVARIAEVADTANHHPDVLLRWGEVAVTTVSHDARGLTQRDVDLAASITSLADALGLTGRPPKSEVVEVAIDALDIPGVRPFWQAVLAYDEVPVTDDDNELVDPAGVGPTFWFQQMDEPRPQRNRIHLDVLVPHDEAQNRIAAAVAAGGHLVNDSFAPSFWVLADKEGNEACICTWQGRSRS